jgi:hypothetical protein
MGSDLPVSLHLFRNFFRARHLLIRCAHARETIVVTRPGLFRRGQRKLLLSLVHDVCDAGSELKATQTFVGSAR